MTTQGKCVEEQKETKSMHEESHVSNRHMTWWQKAWWVRVNNGPHRDRRKVWRAATRAAQEVRETGKVAGREREEWEKRETERRESNTLHIVLHLQPQQHQQQWQQQPQQAVIQHSNALSGLKHLRNQEYVG